MSWALLILRKQIAFRLWLLTLILSELRSIFRTNSIGSTRFKCSLVSWSSYCTLMQSDNLMNVDTKIWWSAQLKCTALSNYANWINYFKMIGGTEPKIYWNNTVPFFRITYRFYRFPNCILEHIRGTVMNMIACSLIAHH